VWIYTVLLKPAPIRGLVQKAICLLIPPELEIKGVALVLNQKDAIVSGNIALGCYEPYNLEVFESLLRPGMNVLDVGANIGLYSAIASRKVGSNGTVIAIEPDATNCSFIERTKRRNGLTNLVIIEKAAGERIGDTFLYLCETNKADHRIYDAQESRTRVAIKMVTLDSVLIDQAIPRVDVLKIDTQGYEFFVAQGMRELIEHSPAVRILMEFWPWGITKAGGSPEQLLEFFSSRGFAISIIDSDRNRLVLQKSFDRILNLIREREHANLYLERSA
jgi:FkbM family methyltransferase